MHVTNRYFTFEGTISACINLHVFHMQIILFYLLSTRVCEFSADRCREIGRCCSNKRASLRQSREINLENAAIIDRKRYRLLNDSVQESIVSMIVRMTPKKARNFALRKEKRFFSIHPAQFDRANSTPA